MHIVTARAQTRRVPGNSYGHGRGGEVVPEPVVGAVAVEVGIGEMTNVTGMASGLLVALSPITVIDPEYVPAAMLARFAVAVKAIAVLPDALPDKGESPSHDAVVLTLHAKLPFPMFETPTVWTGLGSPWVTDSVKLVGFRLIVGCVPLPFPGRAAFSPSSGPPLLQPLTTAKANRHTRSFVKSSIVDHPCEWLRNGVGTL